MEFQGFVNKYSPQQNRIVKKDSLFVLTPTEGPFAKTNGKSLAQLTSCDLRSKNDRELGKQGDVSGRAGSGSLLPPGGERPRGRRLRAARKRASAGWNQQEKTGASWEGARRVGEHRGGSTERGEAPLPPQLEENEVCVIQALRRRGVHPADFVLGTFLL